MEEITDKIADAVSDTLELMGPPHAAAMQKLTIMALKSDGRVLADALRLTDEIRLCCPVVLDDGSGRVVTGLLAVTGDRIIFAGHAGTLRPRDLVHSFLIDELVDVVSGRQKTPNMRWPLQTVSFRAQRSGYALYFLDDIPAHVVDAVREMLDSESAASVGDPLGEGGAVTVGAGRHSAPVSASKAAELPDLPIYATNGGSRPAAPKARAWWRSPAVLAVGAAASGGLVAILVATGVWHGADAWPDAPDEGSCYTGGTAAEKAQQAAGGILGGAELVPTECGTAIAYYVVTGRFDAVRLGDANLGTCGSAGSPTDLAWYDPLGRQAVVHGNDVASDNVSAAERDDKGTLVCLRDVV